MIARRGAFFSRSERDLGRTFLDFEPNASRVAIVARTRDPLRSKHTPRNTRHVQSGSARWRSGRSVENAGEGKKDEKKIVVRTVQYVTWSFETTRLRSRDRGRRSTAEFEYNKGGETKKNN